MPAHIETEQLFFVGKLFMLAPRSNRSLSRRDGSGCFIKQRDLTSNTIPLGCRRSAEGFIDARKELGALPAKKIKGARFHQAFQHFSIRNSSVESSAKIFQRRKKGVSVALANGDCHSAFSNVFDGSETVTNGHGRASVLAGRSRVRKGGAYTTFRRKLQPALVDVWRQNVNAHAFALPDKNRNFLRIVDLIAEQTGHKLN